MMYGENRPYNVALIVLDLAAVRAWAEREGVALGPDPSTSPEVRALIASEIDREAAGFRAFERPRGFALILQDFSVDNDTLTPTLKVKRRNVLARYRALLESLYGLTPPERTMSVVSVA
jgi:long-chain acyl-CoA synthetase